MIFYRIALFIFLFLNFTNLSLAEEITGSNSDGALIVGTTPIIGTCSSGFDLFNNAGVLGCQTDTGSGTVTTLSIVTANGISGTVANPTTTPAVTLLLGAITPSSVTIGAGSAITSSGVGGVLANSAYIPSLYGIIIATVNNPGINAVQGDLGNPTGGTIQTLAGYMGASSISITDTQVVSASGAVNGSGCTNGTYPVAGTTGTGNKFTASITVTSNVPTVNSITSGGDYTANPTTIASEPVTGVAGCSVQPNLNVVMGALQLLIIQAGSYSSVPSGTGNIFVPTSGSEVGLTMNLTMLSLSADVVPVPPGVTFPGPQEFVRFGYKSLQFGLCTECAAFGYQTGGSATDPSNFAFNGFNCAILTVTVTNLDCFGTDSARNAVKLQGSALFGNGSLKTYNGSNVLNGIACFGVSCLLNWNNTVNTNPNLTAVGYSACSGASGTAAFVNSICLGDTTGTKLSTANSVMILGHQCASTTLATGSFDILIGLSNLCDTPAGATSNYFAIFGNNATPWFTAAGTNGPTTQTITLHGSTFAIPDIASSTAAQTGTVCWSATTLTYDPSLGCLTSLEELKNIHGPIVNALDEVTALKPFWFSPINRPYGSDLAEQPGFGAHQVETVDKRLVGYGPNGELRGVRYMEMTALLAAAIKEQQIEIENLKNRLH